MKSEKPDDFDWVTERKACSVAGVFERLLQAARKNVEMRAENVDGRIRNPAEFTPTGDGFAVCRQTVTGRMGVRCFVSDRDGIVAEAFGGQDVRTVAKAGVTLNDQGECRLLVDGEGELQPWQFLKRILEPVMFEPNR
jgi:hypothetical protein